MKIAYCGYDFFYGCLEELVEEGHTILQIFTFETDNKYNFKCNLEKIAKEQQIPVSYNKPAKEQIEKLFVEQGCELIITAGYIYKIPIIDNGFRGINIHPTLLPIGRGPWPLPDVILREKEYSGVTIHQMTDEMDGGPILIQDRFKVLPNEDLETLSCRSQLLAVHLLKKLMKNFENYWENAVPQENGEYWEYPSEDVMTFSGNMKVKEVDKIIRAFGKFDSCTSFLGKKWLVHDANCWEEEHKYEPNTVVHVTNKEVLLAAVDGFVCIRYYEEDMDE